MCSAAAFQYWFQFQQINLCRRRRVSAVTGVRDSRQKASYGLIRRLIPSFTTQYAAAKKTEAVCQDVVSSKLISKSPCQIFVDIFPLLRWGRWGLDAKWPCRTCRCSWCNCYWNRWHFGQTWNLCQLSQMAFVEKYFWAEVKFRGLTQKCPFLKAEFRLEFSQTNWGALIIAQNLTICLK